MNLFYPFLLILILFLTFLFLIYLYYQRSFKYWSNRYVPHPKPSIPFGNFNKKMLTETGAIIRDIYNELKKNGAQYGGYHMFAIPFFMPLTPELYKEVLIKNFQCFEDHGIYYNEENDPMSANIVSLTGSKWKYLRSKLSPTFSSTKLKMMFTLMAKCSTDISDVLENSDKIEIHDIATRYTTDIICSCAFGIDGNNLKNPEAEFREYGRKLVELSFFDSIRLAFGLMAPNILNMFKICFFNPQVSNFFFNIVRETVEYREKNHVKRNDLMDSLIRLKHNENIEDDASDGININTDEEGLTLNQIAAQVLVFYLAGFETSAITLTFCMYELARHPDIQQKVRAEILKITQENDGDITYEAINNMPYIDKVIQETMRKYPPIVMLNRIVTQRHRVSGSALVLDEGTRIVLSTLGVHHDPEFYPEPRRFDPERFSEEEKAKRPPMTYFPFGDGPRICLGQKFAMIEVKLALAVFLKNYKYSVDLSTRPKIRTISNGNMLGLKDKIWLKPTKIVSV